MNFNPLDDSNGKKTCDCDLDWNESLWMSGNIQNLIENVGIYVYFCSKVFHWVIFINIRSKGWSIQFLLIVFFDETGKFLYICIIFLYIFQFYICESFQWKWLRLIHLINVGSRNSSDFIYQYNVSLFNLA